MTSGSQDRLSSRPSAVLAIAGALLLGACARTIGPIDRVETIAAGDRHVAVRSSAFDDGRSRHVRFTGDWQQEEYAYYTGDGGRLELVYAAVTRTPVALNYQLTIGDAVRQWNFNRGKAIEWGESARAGTLSEPIFFQHYRLAGEGRDCLGFSAEWDYPSDDPRLRPGRVLFGYACASPGRRWSADEAADLVNSIRVKAPTRLRRGERQDPADRAAALAVARGLDDPARGNPRFPFLFAERYNDTQGNGNFD